MNYLLDTHTLIWSIIDPDKLSKPVIEILEDAHHSIKVSSISFWEISLKFSLGKLKLTGIMPQDVPNLSVQSGFELIPVMPEEAATYHQLKNRQHRDPFDRMLIWQAINYKLILISKDKDIHAYKAEGLKVIWN